MKTDLRKKKQDFEKGIFKMINNAVLEYIKIYQTRNN